MCLVSHLNALRLSLCREQVCQPFSLCEVQLALLKCSASELACSHRMTQSGTCTGYIVSACMMCHTSRLDPKTRAEAMPTLLCQPDCRQETCCIQNCPDHCWAAMHMQLHNILACSRGMTVSMALYLLHKISSAVLEHACTCEAGWAWEAQHQCSIQQLLRLRVHEGSQSLQSTHCMLSDGADWSMAAYKQGNLQRVEGLAGDVHNVRSRSALDLRWSAAQWV